MDPNPVDIAYWGYAPPLAIEDSFVGGVNTYYATYGTFSPGTVFAPGEVLNTFAGFVNLTDQNGFVAGLPFECVGACTNVIFRPNIGVAELDWMNSNLGTTTADDSAITGTATLTVGSSQRSDPVLDSALLTVNPTPTPEPGTLVLLGLGLFAAFAISVPQALSGPGGITSGLPVIQSQSRRSPVNEVAHQLDRTEPAEIASVRRFASLSLLGQEGI